MIVQVDWSNKIVTVPQTALTLVSAGVWNVYRLDLDAFWRACRDAEDSTAGAIHPPIVENTPPTAVDAVTTLARVVRIVNGYRVRFDDTPGPYQVLLSGANTNIADPSVLYPNQVSVLAANSAGMVHIEDPRIQDIHAAHFNRRVWDKAANELRIYEADKSTVRNRFTTNGDLSEIDPV